MAAKEKLPDGEGRPPGAMPTAPSVQRLYAERYVVEEELGRGGMGRVVRARDLKLDRAVAQKLLPPGVHAERQRMRFEQEARAAGSLNHPNIVAVYDVGEHEGEPYIVTELLEGRTLRAVLSDGPLAPAEAVDLAAQLADGLAAAHAKGVVHRDLKPENLFLTDGGRLKILDFGIAKLLDSPRRDIRTETGAILGTPAYMSPEQVRGLPPDSRSDIFSFGAVLHEMLAGSPAFQRDTDVATACAILNDAPSPLPVGTPAALADLIACCLRKDPAGRYGNASALLRELRGHDGHPRRRLPRNFSLSIALAVALLAGATLFVKRMLPSSRTELPIESLAVLPLQNLSADPTQEYLADGMTEELTSELAQISPLRVISRTSVMQYKGAKKPLPQIARELNVDAVVEGSVQRSGDRVRITAQLIYAPTDRHLWTRSYERELREVLSLQNEVAQAISKEVGSKLNSQQQTRLLASATRVVSPDAYEAYLRGSSHLDNGDLQKANDYFTQAIKLDPNYAPPYVKLVRRVLRPDGLLGVATWSGEPTFLAHEIWEEELGSLGFAPVRWPTRTASEKELFTLLARAGFVRTRTWSSAFLFHPTLDSFLELRTGLGRVWLDTLAPDVRSALLGRVRRRLSKLGPHGFAIQAVILYAAAS